MAQKVAVSMMTAVDPQGHKGRPVRRVCRDLRSPDLLVLSAVNAFRNVPWRGASNMATNSSEEGDIQDLRFSRR
jgi:hypothetical protein